MTYFRHIKKYFSDPRFLRSVSISSFLLLIGIILNYYASTYATKEASDSVTDIVLSNTRAHDVDGIFVFGTLILIAFIVILALKRLNRIPFMMEASALFFAIRSGFMTLTHIAPFPSQTEMTMSFFARINFGGDLFFSGHTGLPFLMALIFWGNRSIRYIFLAMSAILAVVVLLGHIHYTIDVVSAYFITYTIFHIAKWLFPEDLRLFHEGIAQK